MVWTIHNVGAVFYELIPLLLPVRKIALVVSRWKEMVFSFHDSLKPAVPINAKKDGSFNIWLDIIKHNIFDIFFNKCRYIVFCNAIGSLCFLLIKNIK